MFPALLATTLALAAGDLSTPPDPVDVFGGAPVSENQHEAVVAIAIGTGLCTGTLISEDIVLTAAHCFESQPSPTAVEVIVGPNTRTPVAVLPVAEYVVHPCAVGGCASDGYDIAFVRLATRAPEPSEGYPRPIVDQDEYDDLSVVGRTVRVVGYGKDLSGETGIKRYVDVVIDSFRAYGNEFEAGGSGRDSCEGDSGGPALALGPDLKWRIVGVLSRGYTCGAGGIYVVPYASLCWLQDESGVEDLVPISCTGCGCLDIDPDRNDGNGCAVARRSAPRTPRGLGWLGILLVGWFASRRVVARRR